MMSIEVKTEAATPDAGNLDTDGHSSMYIELSSIVARVTSHGAHCVELKTSCSVIEVPKNSRFHLLSCLFRKLI